MLVEQRCGSGDPAKDPEGGCHAAVTTFRLLAHDPVPCDGQVPRAASVPAEAQSNYQAASRLMAPDPEPAPLRGPTGRAVHPRTMFEDGSPPADVIQSWATRTTSP